MKLWIGMFLSYFFLLAASAQAQTVAIIDSGTDMKHEVIAPQAWWNPVDIPDSGRDEDGNGYPDDTHGWNFAEGNNQVIDYSYLGLLDDDIRRFFDIQKKMMLGQASEEDLAWLRAKVDDREFIQKLSVYGNFMHGTHVGGIAIEKAPSADLMAIKLIPTEVSLPFFLNQIKERVAALDDKSLTGLGLRKRIVKRALRTLAREQSKMMVEIGEYVHNHGVEVANGSFGTGYAQAEMIVTAIFNTIYRREPTKEEIYEVASYFINALVEYVEEMMEIAPDTLFVFAAGNDGTDNDVYPVSPTNVQRSNVISVAATFDRVMLAPFSNYGQEMVDVAAPGLGIRNAVPGDQYLTVSGTSQAAPYVAGVALEVLSHNSELTPAQVKQIIESTVDKKDFLEGKVKTAGIVNSKRAVRAAKLSARMPLRAAIETAKLTVRDQPAGFGEKFLFGTDQFMPEAMLGLPSPFHILP